MSVRIAVLLPCRDEATTIAKVIADFRRTPWPAGAVVEVVVCDNASTDDTARIAREAGARVCVEPHAGKGYAVARLLAEVVADYYVIADGDDTYPVERAMELLQPVIDGRADMVVGARLAEPDSGSFRPMHVFGNRLVRCLINRVFGARLTDILSGYRAFGRRTVEQVPLVSAGFEVETELTVQLLYHRLVIDEVQLPYRARPPGSHSKLRTVRDGARVLWTIFTLFREVKPLTFFGAIGLACLALGLVAGAGPIWDFLQYRYVHRVPLAILATGLVVLAAVNFVLGILLHALNWRLLELQSVLTRRATREPRETEEMR